MNQLGIFAKYWQPGRVKTRLAAEVGSSQAAAIYREFLLCLVARWREFAGRRVLAFAPAERRSEFASLAGDDWQLEPQVGADLGLRMEHYFQAALAAGARRVLLIGSDSPTLGWQHINDALSALDNHDVVLGPTEDGGYYLIGIRDAVPDMFRDIPWSTAGVWEATCERLEQQRVSWKGLAEHYDVDALDDLARLARELCEPAFADQRFDALRRQLREMGMAD